MEGRETIQFLGWERVSYLSGELLIVGLTSKANTRFENISEVQAVDRCFDGDHPKNGNNEFFGLRIEAFHFVVFFDLDLQTDNSKSSKLLDPGGTKNTRAHLEAV